MTSFYDKYVLAQTNLAFWPMNDAVGTTATDATGNGKTLTKFGTTVTFQGASGTFDGEKSVTFSADAGLELSAFALSQAEFTFSAMVKTPTGNGTYILFGSFGGATNAFWFGLTGGSLHLADGTGNDFGTAATNLNDGAWHHFAFTRSTADNAYVLYVDGVAVKTNPGVPGGNLALANICIGNFGSGLTGFGWPGQISKPRMRAVKMTAAQLLDNYRAAVNGFTSDLSAYPPGRQDLVLHLTRSVGPAWNAGADTPTFSVVNPNNAGMFIASQTVTDADHATVVIASNAADALCQVQSSDGGGFIFDFSQNPYTQSTIVLNGQNVKISVPWNATAMSNFTAVQWYHGSGGSEDWENGNSQGRAMSVVLAANGCIFFGTTAGVSTWGNDAAIAQHIAARAYIDTHYTVNKWADLAASMGGIESLNMTQRSQASFKRSACWCGIYPAASLANCFANAGLAVTIKTAYGIAGDGSDYAAKTAGHDPMLAAASLFKVKRWIFFASHADTVVDQAANTDAFITHLGATKSTTLIECTGDHGDASHWQPPVVLAAIQAAPIPTVAATDDVSLALGLL